MPVFTSRIETVFKRFVCSTLHEYEELFKFLKTGTLPKGRDRPSEFYDQFDQLDHEGEITFPIDFKQFTLSIEINPHLDINDDVVGYELNIRLSLVNRAYCFSKLSIKKIDGIYLIMQEFDTWIHQYLDKEFEICKHCRSDYVKMNKVLEQEDFNCCYDCFPYIQEMGENCCICLSDEPTIWVEFKPCGHKTHRICYQDMKGMKCPLCRTEIEQSNFL
jgi:hypothetical protein